MGAQSGVFLFHIGCGFPQPIRKLSIAPISRQPCPIARLLRATKIRGGTRGAMGHKPDPLVQDRFNIHDSGFRFSENNARRLPVGDSLSSLVHVVRINQRSRRLAGLDLLP